MKKLNLFPFNQDRFTVLITGDSLSYNRHGYDPQSRLNAFDCGAGLPSWSFALRDHLFALDPYFTLAESICVDAPWKKGLDALCSVPYSAVFDGKIKTILPKKTASFSVTVPGDRIVLYFQRRLENSCILDIYVDGALAIRDVDTKGDPSLFAGYALMTLELCCAVSQTTHTVELRNIRGTDPKVTLAAVGSRPINVILNGKGGECTDYFVEHFDERIGRYRPDLLILSLGANDRGYRTVFEMQNALIALYAKLFTLCPSCRVLHLLPPSSHCPEDPNRDVIPYCSRLLSEVYDRDIEAVCRNLGREGYTCEGLDSTCDYFIETLRLSQLFENYDVSQWRFDNVHMTPYGNRLLLDAVREKLGFPLTGNETKVQND